MSTGIVENNRVKVVYNKHLDTEQLEDKSEVKSDINEMATNDIDKRPSKYHLVNVFAHKKYFDWYDLVDAKRASNTPAGGAGGKLYCCWSI